VIANGPLGLDAQEWIRAVDKLRATPLHRPLPPLHLHEQPEHDRPRQLVPFQVDQADRVSPPYLYTLEPRRTNPRRSYSRFALVREGREVRSIDFTPSAVARATASRMSDAPTPLPRAARSTTRPRSRHVSHLGSRT
jgi:hypothetical protein